MMTDLDHLRKMLDSKSIPYDTNQFNNQTNITIGVGGMTVDYGYVGVQVVFTFANDGEFVGLGASR